jgi:pilus assembly protein Flp/PilA
MKTLLRDLLRDDSGQELIEYALVSAVLALTAIAGMTALASNVSRAFSSISHKLSSAVV